MSENLSTTVFRNNCQTTLSVATFNVSKLSRGFFYCSFKNNYCLYCRNFNKEKMEKNLPISSGVIEAAGKVVIKQRMCNSGMRWADEGAKNIFVVMVALFLVRMEKVNHVIFTTILFRQYID